MNLYECSGSDPINYVDVDGRMPLLLALPMIGFVGGFAFSVGMQLAGGGRVDLGAAVVVGAGSAVLAFTGGLAMLSGGPLSPISAGMFGWRMTQAGLFGFGAGTFIARHGAGCAAAINDGLGTAP